jgi:hypothetical protein
MDLLVVSNPGPDVTSSSTPWQSLPSPLDAVTDMRTTAKWIIGAGTAVGSVLLTGAPLAAIGKVHGFGAAVEAFAGLIVALAGAGWAIWQTAEALIPPVTTLADIQTPKFKGLRARIDTDPSAFYGPFGTSVPEVQAAYTRFDRAAAQVAIMLAAEDDPTRQRILTQGLADASANAGQASARLSWLLAFAHTWRIRDLLRRARLQAFIGGAAVAAGAILFVVATSR